MRQVGGTGQQHRICGCPCQHAGLEHPRRVQLQPPHATEVFDVINGKSTYGNQCAEH